MPLYNQNPISITWENGVQKSAIKEYFATAIVSGGIATFWLTMDNTSATDKFFDILYKESAHVWVDDATHEYEYGGYVVSGDGKSVSFSINRMTVTTQNVLINLLGGLVGAVTGVNPVSAPDGTIAYLRIKGD